MSLPGDNPGGYKVSSLSGVYVSRNFEIACALFKMHAISKLGMAVVQSQNCTKKAYLPEPLIGIWLEDISNCTCTVKYDHSMPPFLPFPPFVFPIRMIWYPVYRNTMYLCKCQLVALSPEGNREEGGEGALMIVLQMRDCLIGASLSRTPQCWGELGTCLKWTTSSSTALEMVRGTTMGERDGVMSSLPPFLPLLDNVHFQHTAQLARALTEADVQFRMQVWEFARQTIIIGKQPSSNHTALMRADITRIKIN